MREHLAQLDDLLQEMQVWLIRMLVLLFMRAVLKGQVRQLNVLEQLLGMHKLLARVNP